MNLSLGLIVLLSSACSPPAVLQETLSIEPTPVDIIEGAAALASGEHLARYVTVCTRCHADDFGGETYIKGFPMGTIVAANLTSGAGGIGGTYSDEDWVRAIRHGVAADGRPMIVMPSYDYVGLTEQDLGDMIAWLKTLPPVDRTLPKQRFGPIGKKLVESGRWTISADMMDHEAEFKEVDHSVAIDRGRYLARVAGCTSCHGADYVGRSFGPGAVWSTNITPHRDGIRGWSEEDFIRVMRQGIRPDGSTLDSSMPWMATARWPDSDLLAVWAYLNTLLPRPDRE